MALFDRWNQSSNRKPLRRATSVQMSVQALDDRIVPSHSFFQSYKAGPATHFELLAPEQATVGATRAVELVALDANNRIASGYTGTVQLTSSDTGDTLPTSYTFMATDRGVHAFTVGFSATGSDTLTAADTTTTSIDGTATVTVNPAPVATHFFVAVGRKDYAGTAENVTVYALDANNRIVPSYTGTVALTSSDTGATLPASYTFTASDRGVHTFSITDATAGTYTVTATASITGSASVTVTTAPVASQLAVLKVYGSPGSTTAEYAVVALDANGRIVPNYTGTVAFTSSDTGATLPADYTFTAADAGVHFFSVTYSSTASKSAEVLTATDTSTASISGTAKATHGRGFWM